MKKLEKTVNVTANWVFFYAIFTVTKIQGFSFQQEQYMYSFLPMFMNNLEKHFEYLYCKEFKYLIEYSLKISSIWRTVSYWVGTGENKSYVTPGIGGDQSVGVSHGREVLSTDPHQFLNQWQVKVQVLSYNSKYMYKNIIILNTCITTQ